jgi:hypothetical protein
MSGYVGDGIPNLTGTVEMNRQGYGNVQTGPGDDSMLVIFYKRAVHNEIKSATAGIPIYEDVDFVKIQAPGEGNLQVVEKPVDQTHKRRWPAQWAAYAQGKDQVADGTPLGLLFPRHPSAIAMLQGLGIMTVQHLAHASATAIDAIGMHGIDYVNYAQKYLNAGAGGAAFHQMQRDLEQSNRENDRLKKDVDDLRHQVQQMNQVLMANSGVGTPMPGVPRNPVPQPATPMPGGASMPRVPSFEGPTFDAQTAQINANHPMGGQEQPAKKPRGWPAGKPRGPRKQATDAA